MADMSLIAHFPAPEVTPESRTIGPFDMRGGTLLEKQATSIKAETTCTASTRGNKQGVRQLRITGDPTRTREAYSLALTYIAQNGREGGRKDPAEQRELVSHMQEEA